MTVFTTVPDSVLDPGDPIRSVDIIAIKNNPIAIAEGATGAPKIVTGALATNERMNTTNVLAATAAAAFGAVGTYAFLRPTATTDITQGSTHAGSGLRPNGGLTFSGTTISMTDGTAPAGTWRAMGRRRAQGSYSLSEFAATLFLRIS